MEVDDRFIPALAGNTRACLDSISKRPVHPRACGEHVTQGRFGLDRAGSSPRLRGTHAPDIAYMVTLRFIPALAGNTARPTSSTSRRPVHPRACGEHSSSRSQPEPPHGSSPRLRGTRDKARTEGGGDGSSPRLRGTHAPDIAYMVTLRFIPALAGNTHSDRRGNDARAVHPRACGEHLKNAIFEPHQNGSSPRLRGTRKRIVG